MGVDLGGSHVSAAIVDIATGNISMRRRMDLPDRSLEFVVEAIAAMTSDIQTAAGTQIRLIGVGAPGNIDTASGIVRSSPNFGWRDAPLSEALRSRVGVDTIVMNDARCAAFGEYLYGPARATRSFVLLTLGTGIGGGIVLDGRPLMGNAMGAGEIGHHTIRAEGGFPCSCGRLGCFEAHASATGLLRHARVLEPYFPDSALHRGGATPLSGRAIQQAAAAGDPHAALAWSNYVADLAVGIANVISFLDPEAIALGGGVAQAGNFLLDDLRARVGARTVTVRPGATRIEAASLLDDAGLVGAAAFAAQVRGAVELQQ